MVDLGQDLDLIRAIVGRGLRGAAEMAGNVMEVSRAPLDRDSGRLLEDWSEIAAAIARKQDVIDARGDLQVACDPAGRHECRHGDRHDGDLGHETGLGRHSIEDFPEGELGQAAGNEQVSRPIRHGRSDSADV